MVAEKKKARDNRERRYRLLAVKSDLIYWFACGVISILVNVSRLL
jgi:hypothetical protein